MWVSSCFKLWVYANYVNKLTVQCSSWMEMSICSLTVNSPNLFCLTVKLTCVKNKKHDLFYSVIQNSDDKWKLSLSERNPTCYYTDLTFNEQHKHPILWLWFAHCRNVDFSIPSKPLIALFVWLQCCILGWPQQENETEVKKLVNSRKLALCHFLNWLLENISRWIQSFLFWIFFLHFWKTPQNFR